MLVHGTAEMSSNEVSEMLDYNGAYMNATSADNYTHISLNSLNKNINEVLPLLKSLIENPAIPEREFEVLKAQVKSAYQTAREKVKYIAQVAGRQMYFGENHPIAYAITDNDVDGLTRADELDFHKKFFRPENMILVMSGKVGDKEIECIEKCFGVESITNQPNELRSVERTPSANRQSVVHKEGALQSAVYMMHEAVPRNHPDYINMRFLVTALGGYFGSRLMQNIREDKGYTYGINSMLIGRKSGSKVVIASECDNVYAEPLIEETRKEILRLQNELMCDEELEIVRNCMLSDLAKTLDSPFSMASCVSSNILYGTGEDYYNRQVRDIKNITAKKLLEVANEQLNVDEFYVSVAGDKKQLTL
jgi:predicted Zn-dependent peptidase